MSRVEIDIKEKPRCYYCMKPAEFVVVKWFSFLVEFTSIRNYCEKCMKLERTKETDKLMSNLLKKEK